VVMRPAILFVFTCALSAAAPSTHAQLYKWVDDSGVVNYGDWPPSGVRLQPVNRGTLSSVDDRALQAPPDRAADAARTGPRSAGPAITGGNEASLPSATASPGGASVDGTYVPYYGYDWRPMAAAAAERRPANAPVAKPLLPIDPSIPDMPLRPRR
jgi:hypothetical protein